MKNLNIIHQTDQEKQQHATESTTEAVNVACETIVQAIKNIPEVKIPEPKDFPDMSCKLDEVIKAVKDIPKTVIPEQKDFPTFPKFPEIKPTDMSKTNVLLEKILNKEEKEYPEFPEIPQFPEIPKIDLTQTNKLLQKLLDRNEDLEITATLDII